LAGLQARYAASLARVERERSYLEEAERNLADLKQAQDLVQKVAEAVQVSCHAQVASVVSRCLEAVFGEEEAYRLRIHFARKRGKTEARLALGRGKRELLDPTDMAGGGVVDLLSFALRVSALVLRRPRQRLFVAMDEPFKHLSAGYRPRARELLEVLAREMGVQLLLVTHSRKLACGKVVELGG
jgi:DNA repair exonuclease SbcCD ATPase subunit